jgi:hypothetical protein
VVHDKGGAASPAKQALEHCCMWLHRLGSKTPLAVLQKLPILYAVQRTHSWGKGILQFLLCIVQVFLRCRRSPATPCPSVLFLSEETWKTFTALSCLRTPLKLLYTVTLSQSIIRHILSSVLFQDSFSGSNWRFSTIIMKVLKTESITSVPLLISRTNKTGTITRFEITTQLGNEWVNNCTHNAQ